MKVLIIGASRGIGAELLKQTLEAGHTVTVLARDPARISVTHPDLSLIAGDILDRATVHSAVFGQDAVCLTIGVPITFRPVSVFSRGTMEVIQAMQEHQVRRLLCVTGIGAGDSKGHGGFLYDHIFQPLLLGPIYRDKDIQEEYIRESGLDWVILRPAGLTNGPRTGKFKAITDLTSVTAGRISRADVAAFMVRELKESGYLRQTPLLTY